MVVAAPGKTNGRKKVAKVRAKKTAPVPAKVSERSPEAQALIDRWKERERPPRFLEKNAKKEVKPDTDDELLWSVRFSKMLGGADPYLAELLLGQVGNCFSHAFEKYAANASTGAIHGIAPRDELEAMLAVQMLATHNTAMEMLRRALIPDQPCADEMVNRSTKLLRTFTAQMEALNRHRGKGQQKMTVEHVHVHQGGQAIVGPVNQSPPRGGRGST